MTRLITFRVSIQLVSERPYVYQFDDIGFARFLIDWGLADKATEVDRLMVGGSITVYRKGLVVALHRIGILN